MCYPNKLNPTKKHSIKCIESYAELCASAQKMVDNQACKHDSGKPQLRLVPTEIIRAIAAVREYGNRIYGDADSWKQVEEWRYWDAAFRHLLDCIDNPDSVDIESGLPSLWHIACNVAFLCEKQKGRVKCATSKDHKDGF